MKSQDNKQIQGYTSEDIEKNKTMAGLSYLLFFLPLIVCPESKFGKFHANQALLLWIVGIAGSVLFNFIPFVGGILKALLSLAVLIFGIMGMVNAFGGKAEELPIIGKYRIIE